MAVSHHRPEWTIAERETTPEAIYLKRREFLRKLGFGGLQLLAAGSLWGALQGYGGDTPSASSPVDKPPPRQILPKDPSKNDPPDAQAQELYPAKRNEHYQVKERKLTPENPV